MTSTKLGSKRSTAPPSRLRCAVLCLQEPALQSRMSINGQFEKTRDVGG